MKRILCVVSYDGTNYHGWQVQPNAVTIEGKLNQAIKKLTGEEIEVIGASRTDAGVHALGNVAVFDTQSPIPGEKFSYALNQYLPADIVIQKSCEVSGSFHPRRLKTVKTYEYTIINRRFPLPQYRNTAFFCYGTLDCEAMEHAAKAFLGTHDFAGFCSVNTQASSTVRTIYSLALERDCREERLRIRVQGNGFLYHMVRIIAGTLMEVGKGRIPVEEMEERIASCDRQKAGPTAPAQGLCLLSIEYPDADCQ